MAKHAVITGGNSGVGLQVAIELGAKGYAIWLTGRSAEKGAEAVRRVQAAGSPLVRFVAADFNVLAQAEALVRTLRAELGGRLDALVHSSGVLNSERRIGPDGLEETWASQFVGRYLVTEGLKDLLEATPDARLVMVGATLMRRDGLNEADLTLAGKFSSFAASQHAYLATQIYMERLAKEHPQGPWVNAGHAGLAPTGITRGVSPAMAALIRVLGFVGGVSMEKSARNFVALASDPAQSGVTGFFFKSPGNLKRRTPMAFDAAAHAAFDRVVAPYAARIVAMRDVSPSR